MRLPVQFAISAGLSLCWSLAACGGAVVPTDVEGKSPAPSATAPSGIAPSPTPSPWPPALRPTPAPTPAASSSPPNGYPTPSPYAWSNRNEGCDNVVLYDVSLSGQRLLIVSIDRVALGLVTPGDSKTVNLATQPALASVRLDVYAQGLKELPVCNDVGIAQRPLTSNQAVSGTVTLTLETAPGAPGDTFVVSARTSNVHIINAKGADEVVQDDSFAHAVVGWFAG